MIHIAVKQLQKNFTLLCYKLHIQVKNKLLTIVNILYKVFKLNILKR